VAVCPAVTVWLAGCVVIVGATALAEPVPVSETVAVGVWGSLLLIERVPVAAPVTVGLKLTLMLTLPPGATVYGVVMPDTLNGAPLVDTEEMIRLDPPTLLTFNVPTAADPTVAVPRFKLAGLTLICCGVAVATPEICTCSEETPLLVCSVSVLEAFPTAVGSNHTWKVLDCPAGNVIGMVKPVTANWPLETLAWAILTETVPVLETVAVCEAFLPTVVVPKLKLAGET